MSGRKWLKRPDVMYIQSRQWMDKGLLQVDLAKKFGVTEACISKILHGERSKDRYQVRTPRERKKQQERIINGVQHEDTMGKTLWEMWEIYQEER